MSELDDPDLRCVGSFLPNRKYRTRNDELQRSYGGEYHTIASWSPARNIILYGNDWTQSDIYRILAFSKWIPLRRYRVKAAFPGRPTMVEYVMDDGTVHHCDDFTIEEA